jgi:hypothetical protein
MLLYGFLAEFLLIPFMLQVSEVHLCVDVADWELSLEDVSSFITRSRSKGVRLFPTEMVVENDGEDLVSPSDLRLQFAGRRLATSDLSKGAPHACCVYDKTAEIAVSRKDWMHEVWRSNGWDGEARVTRVEFRYKPERLWEMGVEEAYAFLDQLPSLWAYSTKHWLRHTIPNGDPNRARWPISPPWQLMQQASFFCDGTPAVRERRRAGDLTLLCQMIAGCSTSAAAFFTQALPRQDDGRANGLKGRAVERVEAAHRRDAKLAASRGHGGAPRAPSVGWAHDRSSLMTPGPWSPSSCLRATQHSYAAPQIR